MDLAQAVEKFLTYSDITRGRAKRTIENYRHYLGRFFRFTGNIQVEEITIVVVENYQLFLNKIALSKKTQSYHVIALRAFLKYMWKCDIRTLAAEKIEVPKIASRTIECLSRDEVEDLLQSARTDTLSGLRDRTILEMLYSTGLRVAELVKLNIIDINTKRREFTVVGKGEKPRLVFLSSRASYFLDKYIETREDKAGPLFISYSRGRKDGSKRLSTVTVEKIVREHAQFAGIAKQVTPHKLRHSFATELLINGASIRAVQELLGHASITTTQLYTHITNKHLKETFDRFHT